MNEIIDVVIIGAGPAGMNAALYASRANLSTIMIEKECPGGKMLKTKIIDNYIGGSSDAMKLASDMFAQSIKFGAQYKQGNVVGIENVENYKKVVLSNGEIFCAYAVVLAVGGKIGKSKFPYDKYLNKGLSYCVVCDAVFYKGKQVAIIGDNRSIDDVDYLSNIAQKVYFINKEDACSNRDNVENLTEVETFEITGVENVENVIVSGKTIKIDGVFYVDDENSFNGFVENIEMENGYIVVDKYMKTSIEGLFACGDIINRNIKQVITACSDGAIAGLEAIKYVNKIKNKNIQ